MHILSYTLFYFDIDLHYGLYPKSSIYLKMQMKVSYVTQLVTINLYSTLSLFKYQRFMIVIQFNYLIKQLSNKISSG